MEKTNYKIYELENGIIKVLYYQAKSHLRIFGLKIPIMDNFFLPRIGINENITIYNTDLKAFMATWPIVNDYLEFSKHIFGYRPGIRDKWDQEHFDNLLKYYK